MRTSYHAGILEITQWAKSTHVSSSRQQWHMLTMDRIPESAMATTTAMVNKFNVSTYAFGVYGMHWSTPACVIVPADTSRSRSCLLSSAVGGHMSYCTNPCESLSGAAIRTATSQKRAHGGPAPSFLFHADGTLRGMLLLELHTQ